MVSLWKQILFEILRLGNLCVHWFNCNCTLATETKKMIHGQLCNVWTQLIFTFMFTNIFGFPFCVTCHIVWYFVFLHWCGKFEIPVEEYSQDDYYSFRKCNALKLMFFVAMLTSPHIPDHYVKIIYLLNMNFVNGNNHQYIVCTTVYRTIALKSFYECKLSVMNGLMK